VLSIEQRVKIVEERMADHNELFKDIRQGLLQFEARVDRRFEQFEGRVDRRFEQIEARLDAMDQKFDARLLGLDQKIDGLDPKIEGLNQRFDARLLGLDQKIDGLGQSLGAELVAQRRDLSAQFRWTSGIMLTGFIAIVAAVLSQ
jgi:hypothetical protein